MCSNGVIYTIYAYCWVGMVLKTICSRLEAGRTARFWRAFLSWFAASTIVLIVFKDVFYISRPRCTIPVSYFCSVWIVYQKRRIKHKLIWIPLLYSRCNDCRTKCHFSFVATTHLTDIDTIAFIQFTFYVFLYQHSPKHSRVKMVPIFLNLKEILLYEIRMYNSIF